MANDKAQSTRAIEVFQLRKEDEKAAEYRKRTFKFMRESREKEAYVDLQLSNKSSKDSKPDPAQILVCKHKFVQNDGFGADASSYLQQLTS